MSEPDVWRPKLHEFFDQRARAIGGVPTHEELCYIAGRDPRVWLNPAVRDDLTQSILGLSDATASSHVLEVGSAAGFLAQLIAPHVGQFTGVDLAEEPLVVARRLGLSNASFRKADGERLPFTDSSFDAVFCYDVFTNFPDIDIGVPLIIDMLRVVKPGGKVLVGSIPDKDRVSELPARIASLQAELNATYGPLPVMPDPVPPEAIILPAEPVALQPLGFWARLFGKKMPSAAKAPVVEARPTIAPEILCYEFSRDDFIEIGNRLGADVAVHEIHALNPYVGFRFNAVFTKAV
jgi:SAM-dependent methyltransferase